MDGGGLHLIDVAVCHGLLRNDISTVGQVAQIGKTSLIGSQVRSSCGRIIAVGFLDFPSSAGDTFASDRVTNDDGDGSRLPTVEGLDVGALPCFDGHLLRLGRQLVAVWRLCLSDEVSTIRQMRDGQAAVGTSDAGSNRHTLNGSHLEVSIGQCFEIGVCIGVVTIDIQGAFSVVCNFHRTGRINRRVQPQRLNFGVELVVIRCSDLSNAILARRKSRPANLTILSGLLDFVDLLTACCDVFQLDSGVRQCFLRHGVSDRYRDGAGMVAFIRRGIRSHRRYANQRKSHHASQHSADQSFQNSHGSFLLFD